MIGQYSDNNDNKNNEFTENEEVINAYDEDEATRTFAQYEDDDSAAPSPAVKVNQRAQSNATGSIAQPFGFAQSEFEQIAEDYREISADYRVGEAIGRGGCAVVLEAWRLSDNMHVVIKVLQVSGGLDEKETHVAIARFMREAELIASLDEKHIVQCVDYGCYQGTPCMVLEFVDGLSLDKLIAKYGSIPLEHATGIITQLLKALIETHNKKIIHRDIKPGNIMVFDSPPPYEIRVLDFGISSVQDGLQSQTLMTQQGNVRGTPSYMAPELFTGETHASIESDLYAVGLVYYECLTGEIAFNDKSFMRVAYKQVNEALEVPGNIPPQIADIILKLCAKKADDRYHSAQVVLDDINANLEQALRDEEKCIRQWEKSAHKTSHKSKYGMPQTTSQGWLSPKKLPQLLLLVLGTIAVVSILIYFLLNNNTQPEQNPSEQTAQENNKPDKASDEDRIFFKANTKLSVQKTTQHLNSTWQEAVKATSEYEKTLAAPAAQHNDGNPPAQKAETTPNTANNNAPAAAAKPADSRKSNTSKKNTKGGKSGRPNDTSVELPF